MEKLPRPEHPNPQFERKNWTNLNGAWDFEIDYGESGFDRKLYEAEGLSGKILVPFCPESSLSGIGNTDFMPAVWYQRKIRSEAKTGERTLLHFGAVDYEASVFVNGRLVGTHKGGYASFTFDISDYLQQGENTLTVCAKDHTRCALQPRGKQSELYDSNGCDYTRTTGIWQTVWMETVPEAYIKAVKYYPDIENSAVTIQAQVAGGGTLQIKASYQGEEMGSVQAESKGGLVCLTLPLKETHLWEAGCGRLYDVKLQYGQDVVHSYFGLRQLRLDGMKFRINEKSVFQRLVLDQGFYPDGIYTAPSDGALVKDIQLSLDVGFTGARLHQKVFEPRFLYHCDRMGYLVWGEHGNWGLDYSKPGALQAFLPEWMEVVERDFNHPAIIGWCPFNETTERLGRQEHDSLLRTVYNLTKQADPTRPCIDTSGYVHVVTDIFDVHDYEQDPKIFRESFESLKSENKLFDRMAEHQEYRGEPCFVSEYGGIQWNVDGREGWGYGIGPKTMEEFMERYKGLTDVLLDNDQMFAFCYTQLYDVEQELNGLYTYSRQPKFDCEALRKINSRKAKIEEE